MSALAAEQMEVVEAYAVLIKSLNDLQKTLLVERIVSDLESGSSSMRGKSIRSLKGILSSDLSYDEMKSQALEEKYGR